MRRILLVVLLAVGVALILGAGALVYLNGGLSFSPAETPTPLPTIVVGEGEPTPFATTAPDQAFVQVVVSLQTVPRGYLMTSDVLTLETRLADQAPVDAVFSVEEAIGLYARNDIYQGETIVRSALVRDVTLDGQQEYGPSSLIPPGYVAMSVPTDRLSSVGYSLATGDFVDILVTFILFPIDEDFQSRLPNEASFYLEQETQSESETDQDGNPLTITVPVLYTISPYGRFERLQDGNIAHIFPSEETSRGVHVAFLIQNAKVIQMGPWVPPAPAQPPTPTPDPDAAEEQVVQPTSTATFLQIDSVLLALPPQQQLFLKYSVESNSVIDYALRGINDGQLYPVENVTLDYLVQRFNIEIPPNFTYVAYPNESVFGKQTYEDGLYPELIATTTVEAEFYIESSEEQP